MATLAGATTFTLQPTLVNVPASGLWFYLWCHKVAVGTLNLAIKRADRLSAYIVNPQKSKTLSLFSLFFFMCWFLTRAGVVIVFPRSQDVGILLEIKASTLFCDFI